MFTGLIEDVGKVVKFANSAEGAFFCVESNLYADEIKIGDSIAVNGACQTVNSKNGNVLEFFAMNETLRRVAPFKGQVNLERAMALNSRLDGHFVSGHIDGTAKILSLRKDGAATIFRFQCESELVILKGSIALNGVSLTVSNVFSDGFEVSVLPQTLQNTNLKNLRRNDFVNVEYDMIAKYIQKFAAPKKEITREFLLENGF